MKKRWGSLSLIIISLILVAGCGNEIPEMTEEESAMITEYAAGLVLSYDKNYQQKLLNDELLVKMEEEAVAKAKRQAEIDAEIARQKALSEKGKTSKKSSDSDNGKSVSSNTAPAVVDIASFLKIENVDIQYKGFELVESFSDEYEGDLGMGLEASKGTKLLVVKFALANKTSQDVECDIFSKNVRFSIDYGLGSKTALTTMLTNSDLSTLYTTIPAEQSIDAVLVLEVKEENTEGISELSMKMSFDDQSTVTMLKQN